MQDLVPNASELPNKTCFITNDTAIIYYIILTYLKNNNSFIYNQSTYRDISFAIDYQVLFKEGKQDFIKYIESNNFQIFSYNIDNLDVNSLNGFDNIVFMDLEKHISVKGFESLISFEKDLKKLIRNNQKIYYCIPDLLFKARTQFEINNDKTANSVCDSELELAYIAKYKLIDQYMQYLKNNNKFPIYRIILPFYFNLFSFNKWILKDKIDSPKALKDKKYLKILDIKRQFMSSDKLAEYLYAIHLDNKPRNYVINSKVHLSILDIFKIQTNNSLKEYIKFDDNYLNVSISQNMQKGIDNYSQHEYNRFIQEYLKI